MHAIASFSCNLQTYPGTLDYTRVKSDTHISGAKNNDFFKRSLHKENNFTVESPRVWEILEQKLKEKKGTTTNVESEMQDLK